MQNLPLLALAILATLPLHADDGAASIGVGGIILMKREPRITMAKEILQISPTKVIVDYDFRNDSAEDITTTVAFPIPAYEFGQLQISFGDPTFEDFKLSIDNKPTHYLIEARAFLGKQEVTAILRRERIDIATFGHWNQKISDYSTPGADFIQTNAVAKARLIRAGIFDKDGVAQWRVEKKYYWTQTFPAHGAVHISHAYTPAIGGTNSVRYGLEAANLPAGKRSDPDTRATIAEIESLCLTPPLKKSLLDLSQKYAVPFNYVDFILTTANTWKTPIEDFTLIVERPKAKVGDTPLISFCWDGPIEKTDATHFTAHTVDLTPTKELRVGFIYADKGNP
jgi:hypothetical protein